MNWKIVTVGKPALTWARDAVADYLLRLNRTGKVEWVVLKEGPTEQVEKAMLLAGEGAYRIALDERGRQMRSTALAHWIKSHELSATKRVCLFVGGADGHSHRLRESVQEMWALSTLTLQHELALIVLLEQLYRAWSINRGEPYHRE
jgi:23S rRNA (pseudouridine1915-N3)-methyltransferase